MINSQIPELFRDFYVEFGDLELQIKRQCFIQLKSAASVEGKNYWYQVPNLKDQDQRVLNSILNRISSRNMRRDEVLVELLPFGFWRRQLHRQNFASLWVPHLNRAFPRLANPRSLESFLEFDKKMSSVHKARNFVAHYRLDQVDRVQSALRDVLLLRKLMN